MLVNKPLLEWLYSFVGQTIEEVEVINWDTLDKTSLGDETFLGWKANFVLFLPNEDLFKQEPIPYSPQCTEEEARIALTNGIKEAKGCSIAVYKIRVTKMGISGASGFAFGPKSK